MSKCFVQKTLFAALAATALVTAIPAAAESAFQSGTGALSASARVDFTIVIPRVLYLRVGTGSAYPGTLGTVGTVDLVSFSPAAGVLGNSTPVAGTGGDQGAGVVTAAVIGNVGQVTLTATSIGAMNDGGTNTIAYTEIATAASAQTSAYTLLAAPVLANGASGPVTVPANGTTKVVTADAKWTYSYKNTTMPSSGAYGGVNVNNGRVTYTAASL